MGKMGLKKPKEKFPSELRYDSVSKDWVVIATGRAKRPEMFKREGKKQNGLSKGKCPFCKIKTQEPPVLVFNNGKQLAHNDVSKEWTTAVIPNKYPAFIPYPRLDKETEGKFYQKMNAVGFHEVVVTRNHSKSMGQMAVEEVKEIIDVYQKRYLDLMGKKFVNYISIFHNHGSEAGASIAHPHSQIITTPLLDLDLSKAISNSEKYFKKTGKCVYCRMNEWDLSFKKRIVFKNEKFLVVCPFASKSAFQTIISPRKHLSNFENITEGEKWQLAEAFRTSLKKIYVGLNDPSYNFYLHTAPCDGKSYKSYHWHWTILPKTSTWAGFEMGTRMEISTIEPEKAADYLRKQ